MFEERIILRGHKILEKYYKEISRGGILHCVFKIEKLTQHNYTMDPDYALLSIDNLSTVVADIKDLLIISAQQSSFPGFEIDTSLFVGVQPALLFDFFESLEKITSSFPRVGFASLGDHISIGPIVGEIFKDCTIVSKPPQIICIRRVHPPHPPSDYRRDEVILERLAHTIRLILVKKAQARPVKQTVVKAVRAVDLDEILEEDIVTIFGTNWGQSTMMRMDNDGNQYTGRAHPYISESDFLMVFREEAKIDDEDEARIVRFIGYVCLTAIEAMFNDEQVALDVFHNIMHTWINACLGRTRFTDETFIEPTLIGFPEEIPEDVEMWMMERLDEIIVKGVKESVMQPISTLFGSWETFFCSKENIETYGAVLVQSTEHMHTYLTFENAVEAVTYSYLQQVFVSIFLGNFQNNKQETVTTSAIRVYEQISDRAMFEDFLTPSVFKSVSAVIAPLVRAVKGKAPSSVPLPHTVPVSMDISLLAPSVRRMLRQTIEYNRCSLASVQDPREMPFVVQGESFSIPVPSSLHAPLTRILQYEATVALIAAASPARTDTIVQLSSQWCMFNKEEENQHDYLYCMPKWDRKSQSGADPDVYTAIINTSDVEMTFYYMFAGRSPPMSGRKRPAEGSETKKTKLEPGHMFIYKREPPSGPGGRIQTWQCRLRECITDENPAAVYMLASIAVYRTPLTREDKEEIVTNVEVMKVNGVLKNHIYSGKQGFEGKSAKRRLMYPVLYLQLTNAWKPHTRDAFYINWAFMQRRKIREMFFQNVVFIEVDETERLAAPVKGGISYDEKVGYLLKYQRMDFEDLSGGGIERVQKKMGNSSVGQTRVDIDEVQKDEEAEVSQIYPNCLPPLRNLRGLLTSPLDTFVIDDITPKWNLNLYGSLIK